MNKLNATSQRINVLLEQATHKDDYIIWEIPKRDPQGNLLHKLDYSLSEGMAGIVLLLAEYHKALQSKESLELVQKSVKGLKIIIDQDPLGNYGLYTGKGGVVYAYMSAYEATGEQQFLDLALQLAMSSKAFLRSSLTNNSINEGRAGFGLVLIKLYELSKNPSVYEALGRTARTIIWNAHLTNQGLSWYYSFAQSGQVSSWLYGTSGIIYFYQKLNAMLSDRPFDAIIEEASKQLDHERGGTEGKWPNHRWAVETPEQDKAIVELASTKAGIEALKRGREAFGFNEGSLGIQYGLGRVETVANALAEVEGQALAYNPEEYIAILALLQKSKSSTDSLISQAQSAQEKGNKNDLSLRNGQPGWAYFSLMMESPGNLAYPLLEITTSSLERPFLKEFFPSYNLYFPLYKDFQRSLYLMGEAPAQRLQEKLKASAFCTFSVEAILEALESEVNQYEGNDKALLQEVFHLERLKHQMTRTPNNALLTFASKAHHFKANRTLQQLSDEAMMAVYFQLNPSVEIVEASYDLRIANVCQPEAQRDTKVSDTYFLLQHTEHMDTIREDKLPDLDELLLSFEEPATGNEVFEDLLEQVTLDEERTEALRQRMIELILTYVMDGVLLRSDQYNS